MSLSSTFPLHTYLTRSFDGSDEGVDKFYPSSPPLSNNASFSAGSTPLSGSPQNAPEGSSSPVPFMSARSSSYSSAGGGGGIFYHLKSSRSKNASKEDLNSVSASPPSSTPLASIATVERSKNPSGSSGGTGKKTSFDNGALNADRKSPGVPTITTSNNKYDRTRMGSSGLSCLGSATTDEESPPPPPVPRASTKPSPDKKVAAGGSLSPMQSISDIFGKQSNKGGGKGLSPGLSPFSDRKSAESPGSTLSECGVGLPILGGGVRRTSFTNQDAASKDQQRTGSPDPGLGGKKTPEGVIRRQGAVGHGNNPDLMAEIKEKRASMVPPSKGNATSTAPEEEIVSPTITAKSGADHEKENIAASSSGTASNSSVFGKVRLRYCAIASLLNVLARF